MCFYVLICVINYTRSPPRTVFIRVTGITYTPFNLLTFILIEVGFFIINYFKACRVSYYVCEYHNTLFLLVCNNFYFFNLRYYFFVVVKFCCSTKT